jgi:hypothetical protein
VRFYGGALQPNFVSAALELIAQGRHMQDGEGIPPGTDLVRYRELCGLAAGVPINGLMNILAESEAGRCHARREECDLAR